MGYNKQFISDQALSASFNSSAQTVIDAALYSIQAEFTGSTCSFTATIQVSSMQSPGVGDWDDLPDSAQTIAAAGSFSWNVSDAGYLWARLAVTDNSSGTNNGTISASINVKGPL